MLLNFLRALYDLCVKKNFDFVNEIRKPEDSSCLRDFVVKNLLFYFFRNSI
jgi:hypothetical protein